MCLLNPTTAKLLVILNKYARIKGKLYLMKFSIYIPVAATLFISSCAFYDNGCEDVTLASEQVQACQSLQKQITNAKGRPIIRTELERRYQKDCIDVRYYRDDHQTAVCGKTGKVKEATITSTATSKK